MPPRDVYGRRQPGQGRCLWWRAGLQPRPGLGVGQVDRIKIDPDSGGDRRQAGRRRRDRAADLTGQGQAGLSRAVRAGPEPVPVTVQLQPEPRSGAQIDQGHRIGGSGAGRRDAHGDLGAPGNLVHLVPAALAQLGNVIQALRAELPERREEPFVKPRLGRAVFGEVPGQRDRAVAPHQERDGGAAQQRGQSVRRKCGQPVQQAVVRCDRLEQRGGQPPRPRRARRRPAPGHLQRLGAQLICSRHARTRQDGQPCAAADDPICTIVAAPAPPGHTIPASHADPGTRPDGQPATSAGDTVWFQGPQLVVVGRKPGLRSSSRRSRANGADVGSCGLVCHC
jgi:hypothetical protein